MAGCFRFLRCIRRQNTSTTAQTFTTQLPENAWLSSENQSPSALPSQNGPEWLPLDDSRSRLIAICICYGHNAQICVQAHPDAKGNRCDDTPCARSHMGQTNRADISSIRAPCQDGTNPLVCTSKSSRRGRRQGSGLFHRSRQGMGLPPIPAH